MSLLKRTIEGFPKGRTTEELFRLLDVEFNYPRKKAVLFELTELLRQGVVQKDRDGKWKPVFRDYSNPQPTAGEEIVDGVSDLPSEILTAVPAKFSQIQVDSEQEIEESDVDRINPQALLRYWCSALRTDPRGAISQNADRHGVSWQLLTGSGPVVPDGGNKLAINIELEQLSADFRKALLKRESNDQSVALGWPLAIALKSGVPTVWPIGLISAEWTRTELDLELTIEADDIQVNPDWIRGFARTAGWRESQLLDVFNVGRESDLQLNDFLPRLREATVAQFKGKITGENFDFEVDTSSTGIFDCLALFLPIDSSFTAAAVRDLDNIATWSDEQLAGTALAPILGLYPSTDPEKIPTLNSSPLNFEQITAVRHAGESPVTVVTGPPGTGKSQTIVSIVASVLFSGGNVLVASKNHQALDAVESRLNAISNGVSFSVRTLDPLSDRDNSFDSLLTELVREPPAAGRVVDESLKVELQLLAEKRNQTMDTITERAKIRCEIADLLERIELRKKINAGNLDESKINVSGSKYVSEISTKNGILIRILNLLLRIFSRTKSDMATDSLFERSQQDGAPISVLFERLQELQDSLENFESPEDPVELTNQISELTSGLLPGLISSQTALREDERLRLAEMKNNLEISNQPLSADSEVVKQLLSCRPLWLASILGSPKRLPLEPGLFDLVVFDEASQCDIASSIPLFARAKRAVIVGDDNQLSFIPQLGRIKDRNLMQTQGLPISQMGRYAQSRLSLFDFARRIPNVPSVFLREQYRSAPDIVDYISNNYYGGKLRCASNPGNLNFPRSMKPGITWTHVPAPVLPSQGNVNEAEASAIISHLQKLLVDEKYEGSIGVITPFRPQVLLLTEKIQSQLSETAIQNAELRVATVDGFQGQERDLIFFSPCLSASSAQTAITFIQKDWRRLNVAISRARAIAHVFGDLDFAKSGSVRALATLATRATEPSRPVDEGVFESQWERIVYHALKQRGLDPHPQFEIAGRRLDFALFGKGDIKLDLEVDGRLYHTDIDGNRKMDDHWRDHQLKSLGWRVCRFWVDELDKNMEGCLDRVEQYLN